MTDQVLTCPERAPHKGRRCGIAVVDLAIQGRSI